MSDKRADDFDRGLVNRRAMLGDAHVDRSLASATAFNAEFQQQITRGVWHEIWSRPGLDHPTRRLLVLAMTMALGRWEEFELHVRSGLQRELTLDTLKEVLLQGAAYCGVPAANTGFKLSTDIARELGLVLDAAPLTEGARVQRQQTLSTPQLHVALQGAAQGVPVLMSHALGLDLSMWDGLAAALAPQHPVLRYDQRGQGRSTVPAGPYTMHDLVDDAARVVREWGRGPVLFVGLSMGGMVGQGLAIRHPDLVRGLVLANTTSHYPADAQAAWDARIAAVQGGGMAAIADMVVQRYLSQAYRAAQPAFSAALRAQVQRADAAGYVATCQAVRALDWRDGLSSIRCPTLVLAGAMDVGATPAMGQAIAQGIAGARYQEFAHAAHLSVAEAPSEFNAAVRSLIASL
jgi:3-oxoadipate enol-lactonase